MWIRRHGRTPGGAGLPGHRPQPASPPWLGKSVSGCAPGYRRPTAAGCHIDQRIRRGRVAVVSHPRLDEVWLISLDPTQGSEIQKTRPCLVVSPDEINRHLRTVVIAPLTTSERPYPTRVTVTFQSKRGQVALDQIRA